jgi:ABC-type transporter Mla MlaB component
VQIHLLKISTLESSRAAETLRLEGHLGGLSVDELRRSCNRVLSEGKQLSLDLSDVSLIDHDGIRLLSGLRRTNVELRNCSPFVALRLEKDGTE